MGPPSAFSKGQGSAGPSDKGSKGKGNSTGKAGGKGTAIDPRQPRQWEQTHSDWHNPEWYSQPHQGYGHAQPEAMQWATDEQPPLPAQPYPAQSQAAGAAAAPAQAQQQQQLDEGWQPAGRGDRGAKRKRKAAKKQLAQQGELPRQNAQQQQPPQQNAQQQQPPQQNQQPAAARKGIFAQLNSFGLRTHFGADPNAVTEVCDCICQMSYTNH